MDINHLTLLTDLYELTMMQGYFKTGNDETVVFDVFYRDNPSGSGYAITCGLDQVIDYIKNLSFSYDDIDYLRNQGIFDEDFLEYLAGYHFTGDIYAIAEGTVVFPREPLLKVKAPIMEAQLVETALLNIINHQSLIATKASRVVYAAGGSGVMEFGLRRAQGPDAGTYGARAAVIGGCDGTSNVFAGKCFDIPILGTHAHSWVMEHSDELTAFRSYAKVFPNNCTLLVDTYDVLKSGVPNAIKVFQEMKDAGIPLTRYGIRLDSGDLAYLSRKARKMLDKAGFTDAKIVVSNSLDEYTITSILSQGGCIDSFGVGERMITAKTDPVFGAVYKICAVEENGKFAPRIKVSETVEKITNPGLKSVYRVYDEEGHAVADLITGFDEKVDFSTPYRYVDPEKPWKNRSYENCTAKPLLHKVIESGKRLTETKTLQELQAYVKKQLDNEIWEEEQRFENPHKHYIDMSPDYYEMKMSMLHNIRTV